jgi:excisionase family DNA binding protein
MKPQSITIDRFAFEQLVKASAAYQKAVNEVFASIQIEQPFIKDEWITTAEAQQITGISKEKLSRMARLGECNAKRVGKDWRFPRSKVEDMTFIYANNTADCR